MVQPFKVDFNGFSTEFRTKPISTTVYAHLPLVMGRALNSSGSGMLSDLSFGLGLNRAS